MKFNTAGSMGDSVYHTLFMLELSEHIKSPIESINIQWGKKASFTMKHCYGDQQLTKAAAEFLAPLFESQGWKTEVNDHCPSDYLDLDTFRELPVNFAAGEIRLWVYNLVGLPLPMNLQRPTIKVQPDTSFNGKIILAHTDRYLNPLIDFSILKPYADRIVIIGLEPEHKDFCQEFFNVDFYRCKDALDAARVIAGGSLMIANPCGLYSIAEQMKMNRMLISCERMCLLYKGKKMMVAGPNNVIPQGGVAFSVGTQAKFECVLKCIEII